MIELKPKIGELINKSGYTRKYIAEQIEVSRKQLSNYVVGRSYPTAEKLFMLAKILGVKVDDLYEIVEETKKEPTQ
jgi:putative transcriptional regulator